MSTQPQERIPALTLGWRLQMSLRHAGMTRDQIADELGVSPSTISRWNGDRGEAPKRAYLAQWALRTGVPLEWLEQGDTGSTTTPDPGPGQSTALDRLTASKRSRSSRDTHRYLDAA